MKLAHAVGMHARPAVKLAKLAKRFSSRIAVRVDGAKDWIDAKSVAKVMAMRGAVRQHHRIRRHRRRRAGAVGALTALVANDFPDADG